MAEKSNELCKMTKKITVPQIRFKEFSDLPAGKAEEWEERKLGEVASSFNYGLNAAAKEYDGENKYIRITDIDDNTHEFLIDDLTSPDVDLNGAENYKLTEGDILFARTGASVGKSYIYRASDGLVYYAGFLIRAKIKEDYDAEFVFQNTLSDKYNKYIEITSQRSGQPGVNAQEYSEFEIHVPSLSEQQKIGSYFRQLDRLITLYQRKYNKLTSVKKSMLQKMFPASSQTVPVLRFAGFTDKWQVRKLGEVGKTFTGLSGKTAVDFGHGEAKFLPYLNIFNNPIADTSFLESIEIDNSQNQIQYGDVFFTTSSETPEEVGMSSVWLGKSANIYLNSFCFGFRPTIEFNPYYLGYLLRSDTFRKPITILAQGISRFNISKTKVMEIEIPLPSLSEQQKIGSYFRQLDHLIALHQQELQKLQNLKKACLKKMFV